MRQMGAFITTSETVLLQLLGDAKHPKFREVRYVVYYLLFAYTSFFKPELDLVVLYRVSIES